MPFQKGHKLATGGPRVGSGRKMQPSSKGLRKMSKYLELTLLQGYKRAAHMACRPNEYDNQVQFAGAETDESTADKQSQTRTGQYKLDPVLQSNIDQWKFLVSKHIPDLPKEIEANIEVNSIWSVLKAISIDSQNTKQSFDSINHSQIPSSLENGSMKEIGLTNGNGKHYEPFQAEIIKESLVPVQMEQVKQGSSQSSAAGGSWSNAKQE